LRANAGWYVFDDDQISFDPKLLVNLSFNHLLTADMTFAIIVRLVIHIQFKSSLFVPALYSRLLACVRFLRKLLYFHQTVFFVIKPQVNSPLFISSNPSPPSFFAPAPPR